MLSELVRDAEELEYDAPDEGKYDQFDLDLFRDVVKDAIFCAHQLAEADDIY